VLRIKNYIDSFNNLLNHITTKNLPTTLIGNAIKFMQYRYSMT